MPVVTEDRAETLPDSIGDKSIHVLLAGHFDPAIIAQHLRPAEATQLSGLQGPPGVPIHHLVTGLARRGVPVGVLGGLREARPLEISSSPVSAFVYKTRSTRAFTLTGFRRERAEILRLLGEIRPEVIHAHWTMEASRAVADWTGPKILTVHDAAYEYARLGWRWHPGAIAFKARWLSNTIATLKRFDHLIAVSPYIEAYLRLRHHYQGEIRVIPNAIPPLPESVQIVTSFPRSGRLTFGCYGGPEPLKNVRAAIEAFRIVQSALPNCRLLVFGANWTDAHRREYGESIELRGSVRHDLFLRSLATEVDVWVHPARIEAHPITICEAIQAGCAVVAGRASGGVPWTMDYGRSGLLVDIEQPGQIAHAMRILATDRNQAEASIAYGREMILDRFSPDRVISAHLRYYQDVVESWKTSRRSNV